MIELVGYLLSWVWLAGFIWLVYRRYFCGDMRPIRELFRDLRVDRPAGHHDGRDLRRHP